ncbi:hypothetical protein AB0O67_25260 [Streptomyces sp. NPDC086077]|uniref:hypothetical protein n=1 Tax=Streptomyces sp. NPDC086077 TaxID=3154862 RepID=UPI003416CD2A
MPLPLLPAVARWAWGRDDETADALVCCLRDLMAAYGVLAAHRFAVGAPAVQVSVSEAGKPNSVLFKGELAVAAASSGSTRSAEAVASLVDQVRTGLRAGEIGSVDAHVECSGLVAVGSDEEFLHNALFMLGASSFADFVTVDLVTGSDVWLPFDLKGRSQPEVYEANAPRLAALLRDLSKVLESETDADDPTYFAKPTETGAENFFDTPGSASDVWGSFEVPTRYDVFTHAPGFGRIGYRRTAEGDVRYVPVLSEQGIIGHLWASDTENAASFEPRDVGDDAIYCAGLVWLERLRSAHDRGLSPSAASAELTAMPDEGGAGRAESDAQPQIIDLGALRGLAADE